CILQGASGWAHWLSHTDRLAHGLEVGAVLAEGAPVAYMGLTGQTTGYHVHWETRWEGARLDPEGWLASFAAADARPFTPIKKEKTTMHAIRQAGVPDSGVIIRDTAAPYSLPQQVFEATAGGLGLEIVEVADWQYQTVIREQWSAHIADKAARGQGGNLDPLDLKQIADVVAKTLKETRYTLSVQ
ncbi:M23 family metallopeptidase, partial [Xanthomonas citri pv. citri]